MCERDFVLETRARSFICAISFFILICVRARSKFYFFMTFLYAARISSHTRIWSHKYTPYTHTYTHGVINYEFYHFSYMMMMCARGTYRAMSCLYTITRVISFSIMWCFLNGVRLGIRFFLSARRSAIKLPDATLLYRCMVQYTDEKRVNHNIHDKSFKLCTKPPACIFF